MDYRLKAPFTAGNNTVRIVKQNAGALHVDRIVIYHLNNENRTIRGTQQ